MDSSLSRNHDFPNERQHAQNQVAAKIGLLPNLPADTFGVVPVPDPQSPDVIYERMRWNTPLSERHADLLLDRLEEAPGEESLDLGCGWGELLLRAVERSGGLGTGVDSSAWAIGRAAQLATERGRSDQLAFLAGDCSEWTEPADRVVCIGSSHAWGGSGQALKALRPIVRPGGRMLFGDAYWERPPSPAARAILGEGIVTLDYLADQAMKFGWRVVHLTIADPREWDEFESSWRAGRERWLESYPLDHRAGEVRALLDRRLHEYLSIYRGILGFAYLLLSP